jgi:hypothetical protein
LLPCPTRSFTLPSSFEKKEDMLVIR